jgi:hypothetical protein
MLKNAKTAISPWLPLSDAFIKHETRYQEEILEPAVKLHQAMRTSVEWYEICMPKVHPGPILEQPCLGLVTLKDIDTWRNVSANNIKGVFSALYPAINRLGAANEVVELVQPVVVGSVAGGPVMSQQLRRQSRTGDPRGAHSELKAADMERSQSQIDLSPYEEGASGGRQRRSETTRLLPRIFYTW